MKFKWWVKPPEESRLKPVVTDRPDKASKEQEAIWEEHRKQAWARERQQWLNQPVVIDGEMKTYADLDATKHRLDGAFRPPEYPMSYMNYCSRCHCTYYGYRNERDSHWLKGCQDILQYVTITTKGAAKDEMS